MTWSPDHTFAVQGGGTPPPDVPVAATVGDDGGAPVPPPAAGVSRRKFLVGGVVAVAAVGVVAFLANSSSGPTTPPPSEGASAAPSEGGAATPAASGGPVASAAPGTGELRWANWIGYIDIDDAGAYPTIQKFESETGIKVTYLEDVDGNEEFFTASLSGPLNAGLSTEWDLMVLTDWMIDRLIRLGWLEALDRAAMPNFVANLEDRYVARSFDPDTKFAAPWQSGMTGLGIDQNKTGPQDSVNVLFSDQFEGRLTYLSEMRDTVGLSAIRLGFDPSTLTQEQFDAALAEVDNAVKNGWVRQVAGNSYVDIMAGGNAVLAMAWSGDVLSLLVPGQSAEQDFQWVLPTEGGMLWTDNMAVPKGSPNRDSAQRWIDFYYDPVNAATIEAYVNYVCPVKGTKEILLESDPEIANNPLIFPPPDWVARLHQFRSTTADEEVAWSEAFSKVMGL